MKASPSDQRQIIDVAAFDQRTTALNHTASTLPQISELVGITTTSHNARDLRIAAETELNDVKRELLRAEADVEQIVTRITRVYSPNHLPVLARNSFPTLHSNLFEALH